MKCLETRRRNGMRWRRYRTSEGAILTTYEVPVQVLGELGAAKLREALERAEREIARRKRTARVLALLAAGWKPLAVGEEVGLCEAQVRRIRQKAKR